MDWWVILQTVLGTGGTYGILKLIAFYRLRAQKQTGDIHVTETDQDARIRMDRHAQDMDERKRLSREQVALIGQFAKRVLTLETKAEKHAEEQKEQTREQNKLREMLAVCQDHHLECERQLLDAQERIGNLERTVSCHLNGGAS